MELLLECLKTLVHTFSCNAGYELQESNNGTCLANQSWSGGDPICVALNCLPSPPLNNSQLQSSCDTQYQSTCTTDFVDGYTGVGVSYTCVVTDEDTNSVGWIGSASCQRGKHCLYMHYYVAIYISKARNKIATELMLAVWQLVLALLKLNPSNVFLYI